MNEGDMVIRINGDVGVIIERGQRHAMHGINCVVYWFKNKTFNITYDKILKDYIVSIYRIN